MIEYNTSTVKLNPVRGGTGDFFFARRLAHINATIYNDVSQPLADRERKQVPV